MSFYSYYHTKIIGIAAAVPQQIKACDTSNMGVKQFRLAAPEQTASDLGFVAAKHLIAANSINPDEIACVIFASLTPDYRSPATAAVLQHRLGIHVDCIAYDLVLGATGFIAGLQKAAAILESVNKKYALLIVGDTNSKLLDVCNPIAAYFGDGSGAVLLEKTHQKQALTVALHTYSADSEAFIHKAGGFRVSPDILNDAEKIHTNKAVLNKLEVNFKMLEKVFVENTVTTVKDFLKENELHIADFDAVLLPPLSLVVLNDFLARLEINADKTSSILEKFGNTSASAIPLSLAVHRNTMKGEVQRVLAISFGEGLSLGIVDFSIQASAIHPLIETDEVFEEGTVSHNF